MEVEEIKRNRAITALRHVPRVVHTHTHTCTPFYMCTVLQSNKGKLYI